ncbi:hypothetical protein AB9U01_25320 [Pseudomonas qingdaonensis]|uniref:hypothetical protein n=1 Tax=Pseudomonas qingdaonensis TaxID=2056231 RepID=UPI003516F750
MSEQPTSPSEFTLLHDAMTTAITDALPQCRHVEAYPKLVAEGMKLPALMFAMTAVEPGPDPGDGRTCITATFEALILVEEARPRAPLQAAILAGHLVKLLRLQYWDQDFVGPVTDVRGMPSETPEILQCVSWSVHWRQDIYLGDTAWLWDDEPPGSLMFAFHPDTGPGSEGSYVAPEDMA